MKFKFKQLFLACVMAVLCCLASMPAFAQFATGGPDWFTGPGAPATTNMSWFVTSAKYRPANVDTIGAQCDLNTARLRLWQASSNSITITNATAIGTSNLLVTTTNGLAVGDTIVIRSVTNDFYQRAKVHLLLGAGSIVITNDPVLSATNAFPLFTGDEVWRMTLAGSQPWFYSGGVAALGTNCLSPPGGIFHANEGKPGLIELDLPSGTCTNALLNFISGTYGVPRPR